MSKSKFAFSPNQAIFIHTSQIHTKMYLDCLKQSNILTKHKINLRMSKFLCTFARQMRAELMKKRLLQIILLALVLCACVTKQTEQKCPYEEDTFAIRGSVLKSVDSMEYYNALAAQGDARAQINEAANLYDGSRALIALYIALGGGTK